MNRSEAQLRNIMVKTFDSIPDNMVVKCDALDPQDLVEEIDVEVEVENLLEKGKDNVFLTD